MIRDAAPADLAAAKKLFSNFVEAASRSETLVGLHDSDADGVTAGVVWQLALERAGYSPVRVVPNRERNAWAEANRERVRAASPDRLFVMDLGSRDEPVVEGVPTCFVDHHRPEGIPEGATFISAYTWDPIPNTSLLVWELASAVAEVGDLDWIAAIGVLSDLGDRAPFEMLAAAKKRHTAKYLKEATALVNASRRASHYDPEAAARALLEHEGPHALVESPSRDVAILRAARAEVKSELDEAKKAAPVFSGNVALVRVSSPCQIHPLVAQIWRSRLPKYVVIVANDAYLPGRVNFSARSQGDVAALDLLRSIELPEGEGSYGNGHDHASGGSLPFARWNALLAELGFPPSVFAHEE
jgi:single-stranded-DNA-specific exonuclease